MEADKEFAWLDKLEESAKNVDKMFEGKQEVATEEAEVEEPPEDEEEAESEEE